MTEKIYMENSYLTELDAKVLLNRKVGNEFHLILDKTIFYPDGAGGQRGDKGTINDIEVIKSFERDDKIVHVTKKQVPGSTATIKLDWDNRFHIMQQHTAQHLVSSCFHRLFGIPTLSFHASSDFITIDLDSNTIDEDDIAKVEDLANTVVQYNFSVKSYFPEKESQDKIDFRRKPKVEENLRVVEIDSIDYSACGGTHVNYTGELGLIKIVESNKQNGKSRIKVLVGKESLRDYSLKQKIFNNLGEKLSANEENIIEKFDKYSEDFTDLSENYSKLKDEYFKLLKDKSMVNLNLVNGNNVIIEQFDKLGFNDANGYSKQFDDKDLILILYSQNKEVLQFLIKPCGKASINMGLLMDRLRNSYNLKGGGNKNLLQGIIFISRNENIKELFTRELNNLL